MNPEISVIIPVYNVENYLSECIESIIAQTFRDFEVILIDDGSKDDSPKMCDDFSAADKRIRVIHKQNGGVSTARNAGLKAAKGKYIVFADSDDYLDKECLAVLYNTLAQSENVDCALCGIRYVYENSTKKDTFILPAITIRTRDEFNEYYSSIKENLGFYANCAKIYKKTIIDKNNICFNENMSIYEDGLFVTNYLDHCRAFSCVEQVMYNYRQYDSFSLMKRYNSNAAEALQLKFDGELFRRKILNEENLSSYYVDFFCAWLNQAGQIYSRYCGSSKQNKEKLNELYRLDCLKMVLNKVDPSKLRGKQLLVYRLLKLRLVNELHLLFEIRYYTKNGKSKKSV